MPTRNKRVKGILVLLVASWFYVGRLPIIPGTWGTLGAVPLYFLMAKLQPLQYGVFLTVMVIASFWIVENASQILRSADPPMVVIDEVMGFLITMFGIPFGFVEILLGFFLFRVFDILKPYPIRALEAKRGGILLDDLMAGVYANITIRVLIKVLG